VTTRGGSAWRQHCGPVSDAEEAAAAAASALETEIVATRAMSPAGVAGKLELAASVLDHDSDGFGCRRLADSALEDIRALQARSDHDRTQPI
jgi:hypothetical protein